MAGHEAEQSLGGKVHKPVAPRKEGGTGKVLEIEIRLPSIDEDAKIWRKSVEYFKIPGVIRRSPGQEGQ